MSIGFIVLLGWCTFGWGYAWWLRARLARSEAQKPPDCSEQLARLEKRLLYKAAYHHGQLLRKANELPDGPFKEGVLEGLLAAINLDYFGKFDQRKMARYRAWYAEEMQRHE